MSEELRCLAVRQPHAWAIVAGAKDVENRTWTTDYRGPIVIQASASQTEVNALKRQGLPHWYFDYGALIGVADLVDVVPMRPDLEANPWASGPYCWRLANARSFKEPIPFKGQLKLYKLPPDVAQIAAKAIASSFPLHLNEVAQQWIAALSAYDEEDRETAILGRYFEQGDGTNALRIAELRLSRERNYETLVDRARAHLALRNAGLALADANAAIADANAAIAKDGKNADAHFNRGLAYEALSNVDFAKAAELEPAYAGDAEEVEVEESEE